MIDLASAYEVRDALDNKVIDSIIDEFGNIWYEAFKKLIASGVPPITLQKCKGVDLVDYKIYGNSIQDGTPTPDNPIEIQSVGDKTKNLWKGLNYYESNRTTTSLRFKLYPSAYPCIKSGNTIAISVTCYLSENDTRTNPRAALQFYYVDDTYSDSNFYWYSKGQKVRVNMRVTIPSDKEVRYIVLRFTDYSDNPGNVWDGYIENIQIEESSTVTEYESPGYRIPVNVKGKNLFDYSARTDNCSINKDGSLFTASRDAVSDFIPVKPNTTYYCTRSGSRRGKFFDRNKQAVQTSSFDFTLLSSGTSFTTSSTTYYVRFAMSGSEVDRTKIQLEEGTSATTYEPYVEPVTTNIYLDEPLRKIGNYADYIDFENKKVVRQIKEVVLDGVTTNKKIEQLNLYPSKNLYYAIITGINGVNGSADVLLNTHFTPAIGVVKGNCYITSNDKFHVMVHTNQELNSIALWNAWLQEQYNNGTPVIFDYALAEEIPEDIVLPSILLNKGTNIIEVDTSILPSNMEVKYYGKE